MALASGTWLGTYELLGLIGSGGMGEVYRARDNKLNREVALKVLPDQFARDPERVTRFRREAQLLAQLNHPNIAAIHTVEEAQGRHFLVMELVLGDTLRERIKRGPAPVAEALGISKQIAEALEAAHEKPIIHRDLKPANVKVTPEGRVKVLDFGLAKAFAGAEVDPHDLPTGSQHGTLAGTILGTPAYMSPEQARGRETDKRTDIWALGCVLFELLTGKQAFSGETVTDILAKVLEAEPDWTALPEKTPAKARDLLRRCLQKDAQRRSRDAAEIRLQIEEALAAPAAHVPATDQAAPRLPVWQRALPLALAGLVAAVLAGVAVWTFKPAPSPQPVSRVVIPLPQNERLVQSGAPVVAFSPDGSHLAYVARIGNGAPQLYVRAMDSLEARPLAGTENAFGGPFFSPDGQWIGFFAGGDIKKVAVSGGAALTLTDYVAPRGATWGPDDTIVFAPASSGGLFRVSAAGGEPQPFTQLKQGESSHRWPQFLPDGKTVLFTIPTVGNLDDSQIAAQRLDTAEHQVLIQGGTDGRYVPTGHLVYYRAGTMMAVPFDPERLEVRGTPAPALESIMAGLGNSGAGQFSFSNQGSLAYIQGDAVVAEATAVWVDRKGVVQSLGTPPREYLHPHLSPDGRQLSASIAEDIWVYDLPRGTLSRLTFGGGFNHASFWTPDGKRLVFLSTRAEGTNLFWKPADGSGAEEQLTQSMRSSSLSSISSDGKLAFYSEDHPMTRRDIWVASLEGQPKQSAFLQTPFNEVVPRISPDGRWLAYLSDESGRYEVYVQAFPGGSSTGSGPGAPARGKWQISTEGGVEPLWARNGRELFYRVGDRVMAVDITTQPSFQAGSPRLLFEGDYVRHPVPPETSFDISPDGQRFLMFKPQEEEAVPLRQIHVVLNWFEELKRRVPVP